MLFYTILKLYILSLKTNITPITFFFIWRALCQRLLASAFAAGRALRSTTPPGHRLGTCCNPCPAATLLFVHKVLNLKLLTLLLLFAIFMLLFACNKKTEKLFILEKNTGINFTNTVTNSKDFNIFSYRNFYNGGGVGTGDINNDGLPDIYFTANQGSNKLYLNKGNFTFQDISLSAGVTDSLDWSTGVSMIDINSDGWLDIYVCNAGYINGQAPKSKLYINNKNLTFTDSAESYGLTNQGGYATHAAFFDYDNDTDLDCFIINNSFIPTNTLNYENKRNLPAKNWPVKDFLKGGGDKLLKNENGKFIDISQAAGIHGSLISFGLGVTVGDVNNDGYQDVYVSNDFFERDYLYLNQKNGTFKDDYDAQIKHSSHASMGADMADINNDGYNDIFTTEMLPDNEQRLKRNTSFDTYDVNKQKQKAGFGQQFMQNTLQLNNKNNGFNEISFYAGVAASDWSWGGLIFDANNDAKNDIYVCNGIYKDVTDQDFIEFFADEVYQKMAINGQKADIEQLVNKMPSNPIANKLFIQQNQLKFTNKALDWGMETPSFSNGASYADLDNDGDLDIVVNNVNMQSFVYRNTVADSKQKHSISFKLTDTTKNNFAIGAKVKVFTNGTMQTKEIMPTRGFQSSVDYKLVFGLDSILIIDSVNIIWPNNTCTNLKKLKADSTYTINKVNTTTYNQQIINYKSLINIDSTTFDNPNEDDFVDFYDERNIPYMLSKEGPAAAVADVNGDGLDDVFIGGAANKTANLYIQNIAGAFTKTNAALFLQNAKYEDVVAQFLDSDNDGDKDLIVGSGGNNFEKGNEVYATRLYINDGKGNFTKAPSAIPNIGNNTAQLALNDVNGDGFLDVFVASRSVPGNYGEVPASALLINDGKGNFTNQIIKYFGTDKLGLITQAIWLPTTTNNKQLVLVGEWMAPKIYSLKSNLFIEQKTNLDNLKGCWQTVFANDVDNDGDLDLLLGNIGDNNYMSVQDNKTLKLWIADFDNNGTNDKIITRSVNNKDVTLFMRKDLAEQIPLLKKQNLKNVDYASKSIQDLFSSGIINKCNTKEVNTTKSYVAINNGNNNYAITPLPYTAQWSCINTFATLNIGNKNALLLGCNKEGLIPQLGAMDAITASMLFFNGNTTTMQTATFSNNWLGVIKNMLPIKIKNKTSMLVIRNNNKPLLFSANEN